jgi:DNA-binding SARP family transcriptional activator
MGASRLFLLDGFLLEHDGVPVELPVGSQRLVAFVAIRGASPRSVVAGMLWPEVPEHQALASLRTGIWRMNKAAPGLLVGEPSGVAVSAGVQLDSRRQEAFATRLLREGCADADWMRAGLAVLWPGQLLPGWYDDWVLFERERLSQLRLHALERAARTMTEQDELETALQLALEAVRAEPLRESANAALMAVYLAEGNTSDAFRQYEVFRDLLHRELDLEPSPRLEQMLPRRLHALTAR